MTRDQLLANTSRALHECYPEEADAMMRDIELRFRDKYETAFEKDVHTVDLEIPGSGATAWPERHGWGLAFEFMRAMQRLADDGFKGNALVKIHVTRE